jgi:hypothetical protein
MLMGGAIPIFSHLSSPPPLSPPHLDLTLFILNNDCSSLDIFICFTTSLFSKELWEYHEENTCLSRTHLLSSRFLR